MRLTTIRSTIKKMFFGTAIAGLLFFSQGCDRSQEPLARPAQAQETYHATCPNVSQVETRDLLLIFLDRSGSFLDRAGNRLAMFRTDTSNLVQKLRPSTLVLGRYISEKSYRDFENFLADAIPPESPTVDCRLTNPFDYVQKRRCQLDNLRYKGQMRCLADAQTRIRDALHALKPDRANYTDVWGAIAAASEILTAHSSIHRRLIIYSDLQDNVNTVLPTHLPGFENAEVLVRVARIEGPKDMTKRLSTFHDRLASWGANVKFIPLDVPINVDRMIAQ